MPHVPPQKNSIAFRKNQGGTGLTRSGAGQASNLAREEKVGVVARVIGRIFAHCRAGCALRRIGACRVFIATLRRLVGRLWRKKHNGLCLTSPHIRIPALKPQLAPSPA